MKGKRPRVRTASGVTGEDHEEIATASRATDDLTIDPTPATSVDPSRQMMRQFRLPKIIFDDQINGCRPRGRPPKRWK